MKLKELHAMGNVELARIAVSLGVYVVNQDRPDRIKAIWGKIRRRPISFQTQAPRI